MDIPIYQVDAFASAVFKGNPAAVCPLDAWLPDETLQAIAMENNLSETAYLVPRGAGYNLRWFTPVREVDLCGHATLGSAYVIAQHLKPGADTMRFHSRGGELRVTRKGEVFTLDFPALERREMPDDPDVVAALGAGPVEIWSAMDIMAVFSDEAAIRDMRPDMGRVAALKTRGVIATAPGREVDFVSRFFAPQSGIPEDPVTGSAHCILAPYWAKRLGKSKLSARQLSARGGELELEVKADRVLISGRVVPYMEGRIRV